jgi:hypothetical protein
VKATALTTDDEEVVDVELIDLSSAKHFVGCNLLQRDMHAFLHLLRYLRL